MQEQFQIYLGVIPEMRLKEEGSVPLTIVTCNLLLTTNNLTMAHDKYHQYLNQDELYSASFDTAVLYT